MKFKYAINWENRRETMEMLVQLLYYRGQMKKKPAYKTCSICSELSNEQYAFQKVGCEDEDTYLPKASKKLLVIKDFSRTRKKQLKQCPECETYYYYKTDYEFLISGTEDEQYLKRLSDKEAQKMLK